MKIKNELKNTLLGFFIIFIFIGVLFIFSSNVLVFTGKIVGADFNLTESINFESGLKKNMSIFIQNVEKEDMNLVIYSEGELAKNIFLEQSQFNMSKDETSKQIDYEIFMPKNLTPGIHSVDVVVLKIFNGKIIPVITNVYILVPYPEKYAEAEIEIIQSEESPALDFSILVSNLGIINLNNVKAKIEIFTELGKKIEEFDTEIISVNVGEKKNILYNWVSDVPSGNYNANVSLYYDGDFTYAEKQFNVGIKALELQQVHVRNFILGEIAKLELLVENKWDKQLNDVYSEIKISKNEDIVAEIKSPTYDISKLGKSVLVSFWNTKDIPAGKYEVIVFLINGENIFEENFQIEISEDSFEVFGLRYSLVEQKSFFEKNRLVAILIIIVILLILLNIWWILFGRKRFKK